MLLIVAMLLLSSVAVAEDKAEIFVQLGHSRAITFLAFSPDGRYAVSSSEDGTSKLWNIENGKLIRTFNGSGHLGIELASVSPNFKHLITATLRNICCSFTIIEIWDIENGHKISQIDSSFYPQLITVSPNNKYLYLGRESSAEQYDISTGVYINSFNADNLEDIATKFKSDISRLDSSFTYIAVSSDGNLILAGNEAGNISLIKASSKKNIRNFKGFSENINCTAVSPDGKHICTGNQDGNINIWDVCNASKIKTIKEDTSVNAIHVTPNGKAIVTGGMDCNIVFWDSITGNKIGTITLNCKETINSIDISHDNKYLSFTTGRASASGELAVIDITTEKIVFRSSEDSQCVIFDHKNRNLISGNFSGEIDIIKLPTGRKLKSIHEHSGMIYTISATKDGKFILSGSCNGEDETGVLTYWNVSTGKKIWNYSAYCYTCSDLSSDGIYAVAGNIVNNHSLHLFQTSDGKLIRSFTGHSRWINSAVFSPNDNLIISSSSDHTIRIWNVQTGKEIVQMVSFKDGEWIAIAPEGYYNASINGDKYLNVRIGNNVYGIDQYREKYFRPDIVQLALKLGDTQAAIALHRGDTEGLKAKEQPPKVWFVSPQDRLETEKETIEILVKTEDVADTAESVTFKVNQIVLATEKKPVRPVSAGVKIREFSRQVPLMIGDNFIEVEAKGKAGAVQTAMILVVRKGQTRKMPTLWYFGSGVSEHSIDGLSLRYPAKDIIGLAEALKKQKGSVYTDVQTRILTNEQATRSNIIDGIDSFFKDVAQEDIAVVFVSGHGMNGSTGYHFIAHDTNPDKLTSTGVSWKIFDEILKSVQCNRLLFADTCHSGNIVGNDTWKTQANVDPNEFLRDAVKEGGVFVFASSSGSSVSREDASWGHGAFAKALIDGILGEAAYRENTVKLSFLQDYVHSTVMKLTENTQQPVIPRLDGVGALLNLVVAKKM